MKSVPEHPRSRASERPFAVALATILATTWPTAPALASESAIEGEIAHLTSPITTPSPSGELRLADALSAALEGSPALAAFAYEVRRKEALEIQAAVRPNPIVSVTAEDFAGSSQKRSLGYQQTTVSLAQLVELGGKRAARRRLADREHVLAGRDYEVERVAVLADTTKAFLLVLALQERRELLDELEEIAAEMVRSVASTVRAGAVSPVEEDRARVNLDRVRLDVAQVDDDLDTARVMLSASWGETRPVFSEVAGDLWALPDVPDADALAAAAEDSPAVARRNAEIESREAALALERTLRIPNLELMLAGRHHPLGSVAGSGNANGGGVGGLVAGFSIPMPVFDRNQGNILAARQALDRAHADRQLSHVSVRGSIVTSRRGFVVAHRIVSTLRDQILPRAQRVFDQTRKGYATGLFRYVEVLDAQRTLFAARRELLDAMLEVHFSATDLERLTGVPLSEIARRNVR